MKKEMMPCGYMKWKKNSRWSLSIVIPRVNRLSMNRSRNSKTTHRASNNAFLIGVYHDR